MDSSLCQERKREENQAFQKTPTGEEIIDCSTFITSDLLCLPTEDLFLAPFYVGTDRFLSHSTRDDTLIVQHLHCVVGLFEERRRKWEKERENKAFLEPGFEKQEAAVVEIMPGKGACSGAGVGRLPGYWVYVLVLCALVTGYVSACPALCTCSGTTVDCHGLGIKTMPRNIPRNTERM